MTGTALLFARYFEPAFRGGGPIQTLVALLRAKPEAVRAIVIAGNQDLGSTESVVPEPDVWVQREVSRVRYCSPGLRPLFAALRSSRSAAPTLIYLNSFFDVRYSLIPQIARLFGVWKGAIVVLAPRGELYAGALQMKAAKKRAYLAAYRAAGLHRHVIWHASTVDEEESIRAIFGGKARIETRENETSLPLSSVSRVTRAPGPLRLVFASRAAAKKGLLTLLLGLQGVTRDVELEVIGAFEDDQYELACEAALTRLPRNVRVSLLGPLPREDLIQRLRVADAMALPTLGENFGHVIAEALSVGSPVICSAETPWTARLEAGAGIVVDPNSPDAWRDAIDSFAGEGEASWEERARRASSAYDEWRNESKGSHIFERALAAR